MIEAEWVDLVVTRACSSRTFTSGRLEVKPVTFETLKRDDLVASIKTASWNVDWDNNYDEFKATGEQSQSGSKGPVTFRRKGPYHFNYGAIRLVMERTVPRRNGLRRVKMTGRSF